MAELSLQQVEQIRKDLNRESITFSHLIHDLLDHICCDVEYEMDRGINFEDAYANVKSWIGKNRCKKIQEETLLLTDNTYRFMKSMMKISGIISPALLAVGALFKIQHWPGGGVIITLGFFLLCCFFLPSAIYVLYKENKGKRFFLYLSGFISFFPWMAGTLFKVQHWTGAGVLLTVGIAATVLLFLPTLLYVLIKDSRRRDLNPVYTIGVIAGMIYLAGLLFKIMHWAGASLMFLFGAVILIGIFLPYYTIKVYKEEKHVSFNFIFLIVGLLWFILTTTLFNLNVSRNHIADFIYNHENLTILNNQMGKKNANLYLLTERTADEMSKLKEVQDRTNQMIDYIDEVKSDLIKFITVDSELSSQDNENMILTQIPDHTDFMKSTLFMCGEESSGKAYELKSKLSGYKSYAKTVVDDREITERIDRLIDLDVPEDSRDSGVQGWEDYYFEYVIPVTVLDILTNYQLRIRLTESELIQYITHDSQSGETAYVSRVINE
jgi:hypothetical protein